MNEQKISLMDLIDELVTIEDNLRITKARKEQIIGTLRNLRDGVKDKQLEELAKRAELQKPIIPPEPESKKG